MVITVRAMDSWEVRHAVIFIFKYIFQYNTFIFFLCQIQAFMVDVVSNHSEVAQLVKIGNSYEGRDFYAVHVRISLNLMIKSGLVHHRTERKLI